MASRQKEVSGSTPTTEANVLSRKAEPQRPLPCHGSPGFPKCVALSAVLGPVEELVGGWRVAMLESALYRWIYSGLFPPSPMRIANMKHKPKLLKCFANAKMLYEWNTPLLV